MQLQCLAHGTPPLTFQWSRVGGSLPERVTTRNEMLRFEAVGPEDSGRYRCQVTNKVGSAEAFAQVLVQGEQPAQAGQKGVSFPPGPSLSQRLAPGSPTWGTKSSFRYPTWNACLFVLLSKVQGRPASSRKTPITVLRNSGSHDCIPPLTSHCHRL